jgi:16S rRNA (guanine966-N2)-methyltransferase
MARLRIISGEFGGRFINAPDGRATHPMGDRVRSALFNMVNVDGKTVLDAYAGSGAIGFEALSRGAKHVDFVEKNKKAVATIAENIETLGVADRAKLYKMTVNTFLDCVADVRNDKYDIVFTDPPYHDLQLTTISQLVSIMSQDGIMVLSYPGKTPTPIIDGVVVVGNRNYGDAALAICRLA